MLEFATFVTRRIPHILALNKVIPVTLKALFLSIILTSCFLGGKLPEGEEFSFEEGEIVYYKVDNMPMLVEKQIVKKKAKYYKVIFKNADGELLENIVAESELSSTPPVNRAKI